MRWYYVVYESISTRDSGGNAVLHFPGEFDLYRAHLWVRKELGEVGLITFWIEISERNAQGLNRLATEIDQEKRRSGKRRGLYLVKGE